MQHRFWQDMGTLNFVPEPPPESGMTQQFSLLHMICDYPRTEVVLEDKLQVPGDNTSSNHLCSPRYNRERCSPSQGMSCSTFRLSNQFQWGFTFSSISLRLILVVQFRITCRDFATIVPTMQTTLCIKSRVSISENHMIGLCSTKEFYSVNVFGTCTFDGSLISLWRSLHMLGTVIHESLY